MTLGNGGYYSNDSKGLLLIINDILLWSLRLLWFESDEVEVPCSLPGATITSSSMDNTEATKSNKEQTNEHRFFGGKKKKTVPP